MNGRTVIDKIIRFGHRCQGRGIRITSVELHPEVILYVQQSCELNLRHERHDRGQMMNFNTGWGRVDLITNNRIVFNCALVHGKNFSEMIEIFDIARMPLFPFVEGLSQSTMAGVEEELAEEDFDFISELKKL